MIPIDIYCEKIENCYDVPDCFEDYVAADLTYQQLTNVEV